MSSFPDAWAAVRGRPWLFLASWWPWRSLAYLLTAVPLGLVTGLVLLFMLSVGVASSVFVVGLFVLAGIPTVTAAVSVLERVRLRLVLPRDGDAAPSLRDRLRAGRGIPVAWSEIGYAVLLGALLWLVDATVLVFAVTVPGVLLLAPWIVTYDVIGIFSWQIDSPDEAWFAALGPGVVAAVAAAYLVTALASGQAALTRLLLDPPEARLVEAVADLRRSRVDLVDAFESERRRIERDLHDGVQQRLVALTMTLGRAELDVPDGPGLELVQEARRQAEGALEDVRFTVRGIHPRVLTDHGLPAAVHDIADRSPVPVDADIALDDRLPAPVEAAAYFVVSEALTNVVRHSRARSAQVRGWLEPGGLVLTVTDDGVGGADVTRGSGLAGLALRMEALDGEFDVHSPPGGPTEVRMACPVP